MAVSRKAKKPRKLKLGTSSTAQRRLSFIDAYFVYNQNGAAAMRSLGYAPKTAGTMASRALRDPKVRDAIAAKAKALADKIELSAEEVIRSLARALRFDPGKLYNADGTLKAVQDMPDEVRLELEGVDVETTVKRTSGVRKKASIATVTTAKVRFPKRDSAREQAMKHFGLFARDKQGAHPDDDGPPPESIPVTVNFRDARRRKPTGGD